VDNLLEQVEQDIRERRLLRSGQSVLVAVSGGVDSMVLLMLLRRLSAKNRWRITVAHLNHQLRGRSSDADEQLVRRTARKLKLPMVVKRSDVRKYARTQKLSLEMAARKLRHDFLAATALRLRIPAVALAHHADDQNELFLLRILRGSGGDGLTGMKWRNPSPGNQRIQLVRPFLEQPKSVLRAYAARENIAFREDATNACVDMDRNRLRHQLLPLLRRDYQPGLDKVLGRVRRIVGAEAQFAQGVAFEWLLAQHFLPRPLRADLSSNSTVQPRTTFDELPVAVQRRAIQMQLHALKFPGDFELVERLRMTASAAVSMGVTRGPSGAQKSISVIRDPEGRVTIAQSGVPQFETNCLKTHLAGRSGVLAFEGVRINWSVIARSGANRLSGTRQTEQFDASEVGKTIVLRHWRAGDRFQPIGMAKSVKLQDFFTNEKIPRVRRHTLIVATTGSGEVFWVEGQRISERFKLTKGTIKRLQWRWRRP
jgi:tRNA(Ile)-lysidine synthase